MIMAIALNTVPTIANTLRAPTPSVTSRYDLQLLDTDHQPFQPTAVLQALNDICFLDVDGVWVAKGDLGSLAQGVPLIARHFPVDKAGIEGIPVQEFNNFVYYPPDNSLIILDKAGSLFEFLLDSHKWRTFRASAPFLAGAPDPDFVDLACVDNQIVVLDPERNEFWRIDRKTKRPQPLFKQTLPWRVKPGDIYVGDGICLAYDGSLYMLRRTGSIAKYNLFRAALGVKQVGFTCRHIAERRRGLLLSVVRRYLWLSGKITA